MRIFVFCFRCAIAISIFLTGGLFCYGQTSADNRSPMFGDSNERQPKPVLEMFEKRRIEREQKEYDQVIEKGDELLSLSMAIAKAFAENGKLSDREKTQLAAVEKLAKQIRSHLGGDDDGSPVVQEVSQNRQGPGSVVVAFSEAAVDLVEELKKTTRFSISASAIESSNAVLGLTRLLRASR